jgi:hypothetical protein
MFRISLPKTKYLWFWLLQQKRLAPERGKEFANAKKGSA